MIRKTKIKIKMLGNYQQYEVGQIIEISEDEAGKLVSLGYAQRLDEVTEEVPSPKE